MFIEAHLSSKLWPLPAKYAVYVYNNTPHSSLQGRSPNEVYEDQSDLSKIYTFGSIPFALQSQGLMNNLEDIGHAVKYCLQSSNREIFPWTISEKKHKLLESQEV
jgi:hypothetical protein